MTIYDYAKKEGDEDRSPDDSLFRQLAMVYSLKHPVIRTECACASDHFHYGVTRGSDWYSLQGGMQDFSYLYTNCMDLTIELLCGKNPGPEEVEQHWEHNREPLLGLVETAYSAVRGLVLDREGRAAAGARVRVRWQGRDVVTSDRGEADCSSSNRQSALRHQ